jgi:hypothetical protein
LRELLEDFDDDAEVILRSVDYRDQYLFLHVGEPVVYTENWKVDVVRRGVASDGEQQGLLLTPAVFIEDGDG